MHTSSTIYYFSPSRVSVLPADLQELYEEAGSWPKDAFELTREEFNKYIAQTPPDGKTLGSKDNKPAWVTKVITNDEKKHTEIAWRDQEITRVRDELELVQDGRGVGTEKEWRDYRNALRDYTEAKKFPKNKRPISPDNNIKQEK